MRSRTSARASQARRRCRPNCAHFWTESIRARRASPTCPRCRCESWHRLGLPVALRQRRHARKGCRRAGLRARIDGDAAELGVRFVASLARQPAGIVQIRGGESTVSLPAQAGSRWPQPAPGAGCRARTRAPRTARCAPARRRHGRDRWRIERCGRAGRRRDAASADAMRVAIPTSRSHARIPVLFSRRPVICCILDRR